MNGSSLNQNDWLILVSEQKVVDSFGARHGFIGVVDINDNLQQLLMNVSLIQVGEYHSGDCYVAQLPYEINGVIDQNNNNGVGDDPLIHFRSLMGSIPEYESRLLSRALQLLTWNRQHQFCGQCGQKNIYVIQEQSLNCETCGLSNYPRISPCMMCLVTKDDYCLLAQHQRHKQGMYSTLAGFVEAGESIEHTVHREVMEEVGLKVSALNYFTTQAWPFPHQLMVGYFAEYSSGDITIDDDEIIDAQWFHYTDLPEIPSPETLSGMMIAEFVQQRKKVSAIS